MYREGSGRWYVDMGQLHEDSDPEVGYISSDESGQGGDMGERLRVKPTRDIWETGKFEFGTKCVHESSEIHLCFCGFFNGIASL